MGRLDGLGAVLKTEAPIAVLLDRAGAAGPLKVVVLRGSEQLYKEGQAWGPHAVCHSLVAINIC